MRLHYRHGDDERLSDRLSDGKQSLGRSVGWWVPSDGVEIVPEDAGGLKGIDYLDYVHGYGIGPTRYFHDLILKLKADGYVEKESLLGFPYDWRLPFWQLDWDGLRLTIERRFAETQSQKVVLFGHSLGSLALNYFLQTHVTPAWKEKHVQAFITVNGAFGGSVKVARALLSGCNPADIPFLRHWDIPQPVSDTDVRDLSQTLASLFLLTPHEEIYSEAYPVVTMVSGSEAASNLTQELFTMGNWSRMIGDSETKGHIINARRVIRDLAIADPGVPVLCIYSVYDTPQTEAHYVYTDYNFNRTPAMSMVEGDGTLQLSSLRVCQSWASTVSVKEFRNLDHMYALRAPELIDYIVQVLRALRGEK